MRLDSYKFMIKLRRVSVHNLRGIDLDLPTGKLVVICGRSGSGKSSLAIDTLYAEGQRRYIETFSARTRQFLEKFEKPDALQIDGIPVSVAVTGKIEPRLNRGTVGTVSGVMDYLRLLFSKIGRLFCPSCGNEIVISTPEKILQKLPALLCSLRPNYHSPESIIETKIQIAFEPSLPTARDEFIQTWRERGFARCIILDQTYRLDESEITTDLYKHILQNSKQNKLNRNKKQNTNPELPVLIIVDRLRSGKFEEPRFIDSLNTAYRYGDDNCCLLLQNLSGANIPFYFAQQLFCANCRLNFPALEPQLFNPDSPLGACPECFGGADSDVTAKSGKSVARSKKSSAQVCSCGGSYLRAESRAVRIGGRNIVELSDLSADILRNEISDIMSKLPDYELAVSREIFEQILIRLGYFREVGLGYLAMSRRVNTLSGGEGRRVYLSGALGSSLVEIMYVLDEPSIGLHPCDSQKLINLIYKLRDNGNTVVVVEHEEIFLRGADHLVEIGLGAGDAGGNVIFQGTPDEMITSTQSLTGQYLRKNFRQNHTEHNSASESFLSEKNKNTAVKSQHLQQPNSKLSPRQISRIATGQILITGCCGNNLRDISVSFPLGQLCVVTGVSGAGKSTLVFDTLYPALCKSLGKKPVGGANFGLPYDKLSFSGVITDAVTVTQGIYVKTARSNSATYLKIFDEIRNIFASTTEARLRNYGAGRFSFNVAGGRCENCQGEGVIVVDMQFMPDMYIRCPECRGKRYRADTLEVLYRGKNIAEVLEMTAREAFIFFRGQVKLQRRLKRMIDVGLDYIRIGQRLDTLSGGELQRLKLASYLMQIRNGSSLLLLDEPTTGLHFADVEQLLICFDMLLEMGHSLIVIEHNLQVIEAADHIIDIGPGAADKGGKIVAEGTPKEISNNPNSKIGKFLKWNN
ncbi:MAG: excinuclease ABC subunit UvrA [Planctomycetaceae bacterium]|jgi:excinuclease ABC subunit A|nr:excinuclease ABC subunit UvrA [Planctomycetaceae bacterium]